MKERALQREHSGERIRTVPELPLSKLKLSWKVRELEGGGPANGFTYRGAQLANCLCTRWAGSTGFTGSDGVLSCRFLEISVYGPTPLQVVHPAISLFLPTLTGCGNRKKKSQLLPLRHLHPFPPHRCYLMASSCQMNYDS